jgi:hypothetical protein
MTMSDTEIKALAAEARIHADNSAADVERATTRFELVRLSALAAEARKIADCLEIISKRPDIDRDAEV